MAMESRGAGGVGCAGAVSVGPAAAKGPLVCWVLQETAQAP